MREKNKTKILARKLYFFLIFKHLKSKDLIFSTGGSIYGTTLSNIGNEQNILAC